MKRFSELMRTTLLASILLLISVPCIHGQEDEDLIFDVIDIVSMTAVIEAPKWPSEVTPQPTDALKRLVLSRPIALSFVSGRWKIRPGGDDESKVSFRLVDMQTYPLAVTDAKAAQAMLDIPYVREYRQCMRSALRDLATEECAKKLVKLASQETDTALRTYLQANLGAELTRMSVNNRAWQTYMNTDRSTELQACLSAYTHLESAKLNGIARGVSAGPQFKVVELPFSDQTGDAVWWDFKGSFPSGTDPSVSPAKLVKTSYVWQVGDNASVQIAKKGTPGVLYTMYFTGGESIIVKANLGGNDYKALDACVSLDDIVAFAEKRDGAVFLSRPGQYSVGKLKIQQ